MWDKWGTVISEDTVTENISRCGAAVTSDLPLEEGRFLQVINPTHTGSFVARVRAKSSSSVGAERRLLLHLEFVNQEWPLQERLFEASR